ncbi:hypothetical protein LguiB_021684 [Lonicera macranthoides]
MWLQEGLNDVRVRAICGMGDIGKTTVAKYVYNQNFVSFDDSSFLANIREVSEQPNGLLCLQRQLLSDISRRKQGTINNVDEGLSKIRNVSPTLFGILVIRVLNADINPLNSNTGEVKWWQLIVWSIVPTPRKGPETLWASLPCSLRELSLSGCNLSDDSFPGTFEYGIFSIYFPSGAIPIFSGEKIEGSSICFAVPSLPTQRIQCLNVWCMSEKTKFIRPVLWIYVKIENKTKELTWIYYPNYFARAYNSNKDLEWMSRWRFGNQLEAGDEINITFYCNEIVVKECGFKIVYHRDQEEANGSTSTIEESHHDFPALRLSTGAYFLYYMFEEMPDEDFWFSKYINERH